MMLARTPANKQMNKQNAQPPSKKSPVCPHGDQDTRACLDEGGAKNALLEDLGTDEGDDFRQDEGQKNPEKHPRQPTLQS